MVGDVDGLVGLLRAEAEARRRRSRVAGWIAGSIIVAGIAVWLTIALVTGRGSDNLTAFLPSVFIAGIAASLYSKKHKCLIAQLASRRDPQIVRDLLEAAFAQDAEARKLAEEALPDILGVWLSGDRLDLEPKDRGLLYRLLDPVRPVNLAEAVLIATRATGGAEALPYLERFQRKAVKRQAAGWHRLSSRALEAMADLRMKEARRIIESEPLQDEVDDLSQQT